MAVLVVARVVVLVVVVAVVVVLLLVVLALAVAAVRAARRVKGVAALDGRALVAQLRFLVLVRALGLLEDGQQLLALEKVSETSAMNLGYLLCLCVWQRGARRQSQARVLPVAPHLRGVSWNTGSRFVCSERLQC